MLRIEYPQYVLRHASWNDLQRCKRQINDLMKSHDVIASSLLLPFDEPTRITIVPRRIDKSL